MENLPEGVWLFVCGDGIEGSGSYDSGEEKYERVDDVNMGIGHGVCPLARICGLGLFLVVYWEIWRGFVERLVCVSRFFHAPHIGGDFGVDALIGFVHSLPTRFTVGVGFDFFDMPFG